MHNSNKKIIKKKYLPHISGMQALFRNLSPSTPYFSLAAQSLNFYNLPPEHTTLLPLVYVQSSSPHVL